MSIQIFIAEHSPIYLYGLGCILSRRPDFRLIGTASCADELLTPINGLSPDVLLLDLEFPGLLQRNLLDAINSISLPQHILGMTQRLDLDLLHHANEVGVMGIFFKEGEPAELIEGIQTIVHHREWFSRQVRQALYFGSSKDMEDQHEIQLTKREMEVLRLVADGRSNSQIALCLSITIRTVRFHMEKILAKLDVNSRTEAVAVAICRKMIEW